MGVEGQGEGKGVSGSGPLRSLQLPASAFPSPLPSPSSPSLPCPLLLHAAAPPFAFSLSLPLPSRQGLPSGLQRRGPPWTAVKQQLLFSPSLPTCTVPLTVQCSAPAPQSPLRTCFSAPTPSKQANAASCSGGLQCEEEGAGDGERSRSCTLALPGTAPSAS